MPLPFLLNLESPVELQVGIVVVVNKLGDRLVLASGNHSRGCSVGLDYKAYLLVLIRSAVATRVPTLFLVLLLVGRVGRI